MKTDRELQHEQRVVAGTAACVECGATKDVCFSLADDLALCPTCMAYARGRRNGKRDALVTMTCGEVSAIAMYDSFTHFVALAGMGGRDTSDLLVTLLEGVKSYRSEPAEVEMYDAAIKFIKTQQDER